MGDHGHELLFGSFITPTSERPEDVVALTRLSERIGLDLATFQDHPYQAGFLDTWTLLSYLGAATSTIHLAPNVANLPLRNPAVLARSAASLDLLTGGRVALGLGAGAFWDAIVAMGGRRLSGGEAVRALEEGIRVVRGIWDVGDRRPLRVEGVFHRVAGARRGPAPAHDIPLWVGAYKPRMLALTGQHADGWLPSLAYLEPAALPEANARIDDAASAAGRDPREVRRLLNVTGRFTASRGGLLVGPPAQWVEEMTELALEHGVSAFVLGGDDPAALETFAGEVVPAVRERVAAERASTVRPPAEDTRPRHVDGEPGEGRSYTAAGRAVGQHLVDVHDMLRSELTKVRDLVEQVRSGAVTAGEARSSIATMTMRQNDWTLGAYCASYCRVVTQHHGLEDDAIFPHLRAREPGLGAVIDRLEEEHHVIHGLLEALDRALVELVRTDGSREGLLALQEALDALTDTLLSHFAYEEAELVEPLARHGFYAGQL